MLTRFPSFAQEHNDDVLRSDTLPFARFRETGTDRKKVNFIKEHTIIFVIQGQKFVHFNDYSYTAQNTHLLFLKRGIYTVSEFVPNDVQYESLMIFFTDDFLKNFLLTHHLTTSTASSTPAYLVLPTNDLLNNLKANFIHYFGKTIDRLDTILQLKLQELLLLLLAGPLKQQVLPFIQSIVFGTPPDIEYTVRTHLFHPLSVEDLAKLSNRSLASFKRDFQKQFNAPPKKWINEQRLAHARVLLQNTNKQVSEVAIECGYENIPHFIRSYKKEYNTTPNTDRSKRAIY